MDFKKKQRIDFNNSLGTITPYYAIKVELIGTPISKYSSDISDAKVKNIKHTVFFPATDKMVDSIKELDRVMSLLKLNTFNVSKYNYNNKTISFNTFSYKLIHKIPHIPLNDWSCHCF